MLKSDPTIHTLVKNNCIECALVLIFLINLNFYKTTFAVISYYLIKITYFDVLTNTCKVLDY